jgi:hypothetical protein
LNQWFEPVAIHLENAQRSGQTRDGCQEGKEVSTTDTPRLDRIMAVVDIMSVVAWSYFAVTFGGWYSMFFGALAASQLASVVIRHYRKRGKK